MTDHRAQDPSEPAGEPLSVAATSASRRRLLRGGLGASPVLLTLASRPVGAATCTVASSFVSVATFKSRNPGASAQCASRNCEWWKTECTSGATYKAYMDSTPVSTHLGATSPTSSYASRTLSSIMRDAAGIQTGSELGVIQHLVALSMNVKTGSATPGNVTLAYINSVWSNYKLNGNIFKLPSSGITWDSTALITWARMLMYPAP